MRPAALIVPDAPVAEIAPAEEMPDVAVMRPDDPRVPPTITPVAVRTIGVAVAATEKFITFVP
jgi:hypothetical protein